MKATLIGKIIDIFPAEIFGNFEKRVFYLQETADKYPQTWAVEMWQGDVNLLDNFCPGDLVTAKIDIKGKAWAKNGKSGVINTLKCWDLARTGTAAKVPSERQQTGGIPSKYSTPPADITEPVDDLPF